MATGGLDLVLVPALGYDMVRATMITSRWRLQRAVTVLHAKYLLTCDPCFQLCDLCWYRHI